MAKFIGSNRISSRMSGAMAKSKGFCSTGVDVTDRTAAENTRRVLTMLLESTTDFVVQSDYKGNVAYMNPAVRKATGVGAASPLHHRRFTEFNTPETNQLFDEVILPSLQNNPVWLGETTVKVAGDRRLAVSQMVIAHRDAKERIFRYSSIMRDISSEKEVREQLAKRTAILKTVIEAIPAMVAVVGMDRRYRFVNSGFRSWYGGNNDQIVGLTIEEVLGRHDYQHTRKWVDKALMGESVSYQRQIDRASGTKHIAVSLIPLWLDASRLDGFISVAQDITEQKQEEVRLLQLSNRDAMTGLLNRTGFESFLTRSVDDGSGSSLALLYIDLDYFKAVNDTHGHPTGDQLLQAFAARLVSLVRPTDAVARLGGDQFAIVLVGARELANADRVAGKVVEAAGLPFAINGLQLQIGASVGIAFGVDNQVGWRDLIARADAKLYEAKSSGRNCHVGGTQM